MTDNPVSQARSTLATRTSYDLGATQVEAETYRRQRDKAAAALECLLAALDGGQQWEIDHAIHRGVLVANNLKDKP